MTNCSLNTAESTTGSSKTARTSPSIRINTSEILLTPVSASQSDEDNERETLPFDTKGNNQEAGQAGTPCCPLGWIVVITGPMKGQSLAITQSTNHIGSAPGCELPLPLDAAIAPKQLILRYADDKREFSICQFPGAKPISTFSNNNIVTMQEQTLSHGETLSISDRTTLRFIPFCDSSFSWDSIQ